MAALERPWRRLKWCEGGGNKGWMVHQGHLSEHDCGGSETPALSKKYWEPKINRQPFNSSPNLLGPRVVSKTCIRFESVSCLLTKTRPCKSVWVWISACGQLYSRWELLLLNITFSSFTPVSVLHHSNSNIYNIFTLKGTRMQKSQLTYISMSDRFHISGSWLTASCLTHSEVPFCVWPPAPPLMSFTEIHEKTGSASTSQESLHPLSLTDSFSFTSLRKTRLRSSPASLAIRATIWPAVPITMRCSNNKHSTISLQRADGNVTGPCLRGNISSKLFCFVF